ncbi:MAG: DUF1573 domain-containing protein [Planctomycetia bacterium]|nr:DUF1573 domain-containing protein [Planctomycetia bacterium]
MIVGESSTLNHNFTITNSTTQPIEITQVRPSCGCTHAALDHTQLQPGGSATLTVNINLSGRSGPQRFVCEVLSATGSPYLCELTTVVYPQAQFADNVVTFGTVAASSRHTRRIEFVGYAATEEELPIDVSISSSLPNVTVTPASPVTERTPEGAFCRRTPFDVNLTTSDRADASTATLIATYKLKGRAANLSIGVGWRVRAVVDVMPETVFFDRAAKLSGGRVERRVLLWPVDGRPVAIERVTSPHPSVEVSVTNGANPILTITFDSRKCGTFLSGSVVVVFGGESRQSISIPVAVAPD